MDRHEAEAIIADERLAKFVRFGAPDGGASNKVCMFERDGEWITLMTDERAVVQDGTIRTFASESDAYDDLIDGLRVLKNAMEFRAR